MFNSNIVARDLGLKDSQEIEVGGRNSDPIQINFGTFDADETNDETK